MEDKDANRLYHGLTGSLHAERNKRYCLAKVFDGANCDGANIGSHSVAKSSILKSIEVDSHVYGWNVSDSDIKRSGGAIKLKRIGINVASVFGGFCKNHDLTMFSEIDKAAISFTKKSALQFHYRAICFEYFQKLAAENSAFKSGSLRAELGSEAIDMLETHQAGISMGLRDLAAAKSQCEAAYLDVSNSNINACVFEFDIQSPVACATGWVPEISFEGNPLFDLGSGQRAPYIGMTLGNSTSGSYFVLTWIDDSNEIDEFVEVAKDYADSMLSVAIGFCLEISENSFVSQGWWTSLDAQKKKTIENNFNRSLRNFGALIPRDFTKAEAYFSGHRTKSFRV